MERCNPSQGVVGYNQADYCVAASLNEIEGVNDYQTPLSRYASEGQAPIQYIKSNKDSKCFGLLIILLMALIIYALINGELYKTQYTSYSLNNHFVQVTNTSFTVTYKWNQCDYKQTFLNGINQSLSNTYSYSSLCHQINDQTLCLMNITGKVWMLSMITSFIPILFGLIILFCPKWVKIKELHKMWKYSIISVLIGSFIIFPSYIPFNIAIGPNNNSIPCSSITNSDNNYVSSFSAGPIWIDFVAPIVAVSLWILVCCMNGHRLKAMKRNECCCSCTQCC